jgi:hypothetical protein
MQGSAGVQADVGARQAHLGQARADRRLAGQEGRAARRAALLGVPVGEQRAFGGDPVDVGRAVAHHAEVVGADIEPADIVAHDEENVGLAVGHGVLLHRSAGGKGHTRLKQKLRAGLCASHRG